MLDRSMLLNLLQALSIALIGVSMYCRAVGFTDKRIKAVTKKESQSTQNGLSVVYELLLAGDRTAHVKLLYTSIDDSTKSVQPYVTLPDDYLPTQHAQLEAAKVILKRVYQCEGIEDKGDEGKHD